LAKVYRYESIVPTSTHLEVSSAGPQYTLRLFYP